MSIGTTTEGEYWKPVLSKMLTIKIQIKGTCKQSVGMGSCGFKGFLGIGNLRDNRSDLLKTWTLETKTCCEIWAPRSQATI